MKTSPLFEKAFEYGVRGYSIMPLRLNKRPILPTWEVLSKVAWSEDEIVAYWEKYPDENIGIITGKISNITVVDIDLDPITGKIAVPVEYFPKTFTVETPSGGFHLYYEYNADIGQTANTFEHLPHVDIRNDGGYVVAPPSFCDYVKAKRRITGTYRAVNNLPIASFPIHLFKVQPSKKGKDVKGLLKSFNNLAEGDGRNNALTKIVGKVLQVVSPQDAVTTGFPLVLAANKQFREPLPEKEVRSIFESILKRESKKERPEVELLLNEKGAPIVNEENLRRIVENDEMLKGCMRFNVFTGMVELKYNLDEFRAYQRTDMVNIRMYIMRTYGFLARIAHTAVEDVVVALAYQNPVSPPVEYFRSLTWDKTPRLDSWLSQVYGVPEDEYHRKVGSNWLKGLVKRIVQPGCKFDYVIVIEGKQGIRKSTSLAVLGGAWHVETILAPDNKDFFMLFGGKAIVEFSEGESLSRTEAKRLKAIITMQTDKYRPPYERSPQEFPRQCVFAMTTNEEEYLKDETGNRRWLPVTCRKVADIEWLKENREQLFAEAYHRVITLGETIHEFPEEETERQQQMRQTADPRDEIIYDWYFSKLSSRERKEGITTPQVFKEAIQGGQPFGREMSKLDGMMIGSVLRNSLKLDKQRVSERGDRYYKYYPSPESEKLAPYSLTADDSLESAFADS